MNFENGEIMKKPNFFIVGAPKCGTTAMFYHLNQHPDIFIPEKKEIHFFGRDLRPAGYCRNLDQYLALFASCKDAKRIGEASVWYLSSKTAASEIKEFVPEADIIIMLRNPVDMLYSLYYQILYNGERLPSFKRAIENEDERKRKFEIAPKRKILRILHTENARFAEQVQRYFTVFGKEHIHVIIYDDLIKDYGKVYHDTLEFLKVDTNIQLNFKVINENKRIKNLFLYRLIKKGKLERNRIVRNLLPSSVRFALYERLHSWNVKNAPRPPMDPSLRKKLQTLFRPEVDQLSHIIGRDLSVWNQ